MLAMLDVYMVYFTILSILSLMKSSKKFQFWLQASETLGVGCCLGIILRRDPLQGSHKWDWVSCGEMSFGTGGLEEWYSSVGFWNIAIQKKVEWRLGLERSLVGLSLVWALWDLWYLWYLWYLWDLWFCEEIPCGTESPVESNWCPAPSLVLLCPQPFCRTLWLWWSITITKTKTITRTITSTGAPLLPSSSGFLPHTSYHDYDGQ